ncbi:MAG: hypothetical protein AAF081_13500 [Actinomycetota bacterium]
MGQRVPNIDNDDVTRLLARDFGEAAAEARAILGALTGTHPGAVARITAATIKLAGRDLDELRTAVAVATNDWRDALSWAEYPRYMKLGRDAEQAVLRAAMDADWAEYQAWLSDDGQ